MTAQGTTVFYKWLDGGKACHGGTGAWRKNRWRTVKGELVPCKNGLHLCREKDLLSWISRELWVAEADLSELIEQHDKVVVRKARVVEKLAWDEKTARLFAADCAEHVLHVFEQQHPDDLRPRNAIAAARAFAHGGIDSAAWAAAGDAAWAAAGDAAWAATRAAARAAAGAAAWDATRAAAWDAAGDAAGAEARNAEAKWQTARLLDYAHGRAS